MKIATAIEKMTDFYKGNIHDIYHFLKVWAFAKNIGEAEGLDPKTQETLEMAAVVHDIDVYKRQVRLVSKPVQHILDYKAETLFTHPDYTKATLSVTIWPDNSKPLYGEYHAKVTLYDACLLYTSRCV